MPSPFYEYFSSIITFYGHTLPAAQIEKLDKIDFLKDELLLLCLEDSKNWIIWKIEKIHSAISSFSKGKSIFSISFENSSSNVVRNEQI